MASLRRLPTSKYWIPCFIDRDGRRRQRSTKVEAKGTENRRRAQKVADTTGRNASTVRTMMSKMARDGELSSRDGKYSLPPEATV